MGALIRLISDQEGIFCLKINALALLPLIAITTLTFEGTAHAQDGGFPMQHLKWQRECVRKNLYTRPIRRELLSRFGINVEIPEGMDFQVDGDGDD
jgi:hypothetical protein